MSYDDIGLTNQLQAKDSLAAGTRPFVSATTFDTYYEIPSAGIGSSSIRNFNFSQGSGGTLTLGGTASGAGVLLVTNAGGTEIVKADANGLVVKGPMSSRQTITIVNAGASGGAVTSFYTDSSTPQGIDSSRFFIDPDDFPETKFTIQVVYRAGVTGEDVRTVYVDIYNLNEGSAVVNSQFSGTVQAATAGYGRYAIGYTTADFKVNMPSGEGDYIVRYWVTSASGTLFGDLYAVRLKMSF